MMIHSTLSINMFYYILTLILFILSYNTLTTKFIRLSTFLTLNGVIMITLALLLFFDLAYNWYQLYIKVARSSYSNVTYNIGVDNLSVFLIILSCVLMLICLMVYWFMRYKITLYTYTLLFSSLLLLNVFTVLDLFFFFLFFETVLVPMYYLIGIWGSRTRRIYAGYLIFIYTLIGSFFMMIAFFDVYLHTGTTSYLLYDIFMTDNYGADRQFFIWLFLFLAFAVKIPLTPFHIWLPEAHVEAPTPGSVLLAGVILKLGSYGIIRYIYEGPFIDITDYLMTFIYAIVLFGFVYCSLVAFNQSNMKKIIAYASVAHMNFALLGLFTSISEGYTGTVFIMIAHGITASVFFICLGVLYDRNKSLIIYYYGDMSRHMPVFCLMFFLVCLANTAFPGTLNFVGEVLISLGIVNFSWYAALVFSIGLILTLIYTLALLTRVFYGLLKHALISVYNDATRLELYIIIFFIVFIIYTGIAPKLIMLFINILISDIFF